MFAFALISGIPAFGAHKTTHVMFVMTDGLRWQEVFSGAEDPLMTKENGAVEDAKPLKAAYWRDTPEARREALMPFLWSVIARNGQIYGDRGKGSDAYVTNGLNFSYPGYNETLTGAPDPRVNSNDKVPNPNVTVLEWLNRKPAYQGKIAAFGAWDTFPYIFNAQRAGFLVNAGWDPLTAIPMTPRLELLNQLKADGPRFWDDEPFDNLTFYTALEYLKARKPSVLYISLGETDDWAHEGKYAAYLEAAHRADSYLKTLWDTVQEMPEYRGTTTLIFSPDHGRGGAPTGWKDHGEKMPESKYIWFAVIGPDTPPLGERSHIAPVTQSQIAATIAKLLGEDYGVDFPKSGKPLTEAFRP